MKEKNKSDREELIKRLAEESKVLYEEAELC